MAIGEIVLDSVLSLINKAIESGVGISVDSYFVRRRINRRVEDATAEVIEPLLNFLATERIEEDRQLRLIETCVSELKPLTEDPKQLFQGSLNGQKIFEALYAERELPEVIIEDDLRDIYSLVCPRIATLLCTLPVAVKDWEAEAWTENFRRFDDIAMQLRALFEIIDTLPNPSINTDDTLAIARRTLAQKVGLDLELTGLRGDSPIAGKFKNFFVHPEIEEELRDGNKKPLKISTPIDSINQFTCLNQIIIVGGAGSGKSTWSKWFQSELLSSSWGGVAVRVEMRRFSNEPLASLQELIREAVGKHYEEELTADRISHWLEENKLVFILDGFDEVRADKRDEVYDWIIELRIASRDCLIILTSRQLTTNHLERLKEEGKWPYWLILPFDKERVIDYIERWHRYIPLNFDNKHEVDAVKLSETWLQDPTLGHLTGNPLLLSTLLMVHHLDGSLPNGRSQLYKRYVEGMLGIWDDRRRVSATTVNLTLEQKRHILRSFALWLFLSEKDQIDEIELLEWLQELLLRMALSHTAEEVIAALRERSGLVIGPGIYSFAHKSIAEYFVAEAILQGDQKDLSGGRLDRLSLFEHKNSDRWNTITFLWAGLSPIADVESFIDTCLSSHSFDLGVGILYDQYDRIDPESRRTLLLGALFDPELIHLIDAHNFWVFSNSKENENAELRIPSIILRGISPLTSFLSLMFKVSRDGTIVWADTLNAQGHIRDLLWMIFAQTTNDFNIWCECLNSPFPKNGQSRNWFFWLMENRILKSLTDPGDHKILDTLNVARKVSIKLQSTLTLVIISTSTMALMRLNNSNTKFINTDNLIQLLGALPDCSSALTAKEIMGTSDWILRWGENGRDNSENNDLLKAFIDHVTLLQSGGRPEDNDIYERAIKFVNELIRSRDNIVSSIALPEILPEAV